ncbi:hypothetical protein DHEL01_v204064 [Diaporthe helianthi]|uniref:Cell wall protein n=1 Tax=Diaporthe helianthi TaxID=158607 RepID=A0A2P5I4V9_DIAHE|nr:hypothetical protein DHEL01_v204064 [Diaporthe helianthi]
MKTAAIVFVLAGLSAAEAPQEHSHEAILLATQAMLELDNPLQIENAVFGLLGDGGAQGGAGSVTNVKCLQQNIADQAFTNAKAANDVEGMANALMFRALERNTTPVGGASETCDETAVNPEIAAIQQHQDPASPEAAGNKQIVLNLATQLQAIGADPNLAIQTGTFPAGTIGDPTGDGFICDDAADPIGCIFSTNMLVADATEAEIASHLAGEQVSADVVVAQAEKGDLAQLAELAQTVNVTKQKADLQGESNAKGTIFTLGAKAAAAHPNAADAQNAIAAALSANATVAAAAEDGVTARCAAAVRQTVQQSDNSGGTAVLDENEGIAACVSAQEAA